MNNSLNICLVICRFLSVFACYLDSTHNFRDAFVFLYLSSGESLHLSRLRASPLPSSRPWFTGDEQAPNSLELEPPRSFEEDPGSFEEDPESFEEDPESFEEDPESFDDWPGSLLLEEQLVAEEASSTLAGETPPGLWEGFHLKRFASQNFLEIHLTFPTRPIVDCLLLIELFITTTWGEEWVRRIIQIHPLW